MHCFGHLAAYCCKHTHIHTLSGTHSSGVGCLRHLSAIWCTLLFTSWSNIRRHRDRRAGRRRQIGSHCCGIYSDCHSLCISNESLSRIQHNISVSPQFLLCFPASITATRASRLCDAHLGLHLQNRRRRVC